MLKRKVTAQLQEWSDRQDKKPLVVDGARQVGKTFSIESFIKQRYEQVISLNFIETPKYREIFSSDLSIEGITRQLSMLFPTTKMEPGKTVLFLDEIQACPNAITALKFLAASPVFDTIATGSLLGMSYKDVASFPVGYTQRLQMNGLDFEEFLWARALSPEQIDDLRECFDRNSPVPAAVHTRMLELFREHIVVGGMPEVVFAFAKNQDFGEVLGLQRQIVHDYADDIIKYAEGAEKTKARACFLSVPRQLSKSYKKFSYSLVDKNGSSRKYGGSLMWLDDAGITSFCNKLNRIELPLEGNASPDVFKVYLRDTGLLVSMLEDGSQADIIQGNLGIYKGAIYENIIADTLIKLGRKLYYFEYRSQIEVDFILRREGATCAVEVKSADNKKSKSLQAAIKNYGASQGIRLSTKNLGTPGAVTSIPLYMAMFL
ncbi:MAG: AAA family ATPase [Coriobacteriales bacterium]|nr:AAA family ATPase [Coriobacteriales bacterium]